MISTNLFEIVMQIVNFGILLWLLNRFLAAPLGTFLQERRNTIKEDLNHAKTRREEADAIINEQKELLQSARVEARDLRQSAEEAAVREKATIIDGAKGEASQIVASAKKEINLEVSRVKTELKKESARLAIGLSESLLKKSIDAKENESIVGDYLELKA